MVTKGHRATGSTFRLNGGRKEVQTHVQKHERVDQMRGEIDYRSLPLNIRFPFKSGARLNACYDPSRRIYMCVRWELKGECCECCPQTKGKFLSTRSENSSLGRIVELLKMPV